MKRVTGYELEGHAKEADGFIHLINSGACCVDACGEVKDEKGNAVMKKWWEVTDKDIDTMMNATTWPYADLGYFRGGGYSSRFVTRAEMPATMIRLNLIKGLGPVLQIVEGWTVKLPDEVTDKLWKRTDYTWPCTWFTPRVTGRGAFKSAYDVMNNWGANHGAISYGHIGADLITMCSMLRIPVCMHNVCEDDIYRPAAIEQLKVNGEKQGVEVFSMGTSHKPVDIAKAAIEHAAAHNENVVILDTAGRLHVDEDMMGELQEIKENIDIDQTILVVDSMTGQDAVNVAKTFHEKIEIDGVILTKLDGDTRGGAALSIRAVTGCPILYVGMGEKLSDLEQFYPDRMASRILGMGDVLTLIEKAEAEIDQDKAREMEKKFRKAEFDFNDFLEQIGQMKKMGGIKSILGMMPGMGLPADLDIDDDVFKGTEAIIYSMTPEERGNPALINPSRKKRIAKGAGVDIAEVNKLIKQFEQSRKMMKQMSGMMSGKGKKKGRFGGGMPKLPFGF